MSYKDFTLLDLEEHFGVQHALKNLPFEPQHILPTESLLKILSNSDLM